MPPNRRVSHDNDEEFMSLQQRLHALSDEVATQSVEPVALHTTKTAPRSTQKSLLPGRPKPQGSDAEPSYAAERAKLDAQIEKLRRQHDVIAHANASRRRDLDNLADRLADASKEATLPSAEDSETTREIRALKEGLEKARVKYEDAFEVRRTYEQILNRLKTERLQFSNQLDGQQVGLQAKESDYEELLLMSHDANQSKEVAKQHLARFEAAVVEERKRREKVSAWRSERRVQWR